jgi:hypothetical protein
MGKLWIFGDSFSASNSRNTLEKWRIDYAKWKGRTTKVWPEFLNDTLKLKMFNLSISGTDNYTIFDTIIDNIDKIEKDDIVIIGWSSTLRFRFADKSESFNSIRPSTNFKKSTLNSSYEYRNISLDTINEILVNRDNPLYEHELNRYIRFINLYLKDIKTLHWCPFQSQHPHLKITRIDEIEKIEKINEDTNNEVKDYHYSENGHRELSKIIYNKLYE